VRDELPARLVQEPDADGVGVARPRDLAEEVPQERLEVQGRGDGPRDAQQRLRLPQLLLGLPSQLGVLQREPDLRGHALDEAQLGGRDGPGARPPRDEQAAHHLAAHRRRREEQSPRMHAGQERGIHPRVGRIVARPDGAAGLPGFPQDREACERERCLEERGEKVLRHPVAGDRHQRLGARRQEVGAHDVGAERAADRAGHLPHRLGLWQATGERLGDLEKRLGLAQAVAGLPEQASVLERHGRLVGEDPRERRSLRIEDVPGGTGHRQRPDDPVLHGQPHGQDRPELVPLQGGPDLGRWRHPRIGQHVGRDDHLARAQRDAHDAGSPGERLAGPGQLAERRGVAVVEPLEAGRGGAEQGPDAVHDPLADDVGIERLREDSPDLGELLRHAPPALGLRVQRRVLDCHRGMGGDAAGDRDLLGREDMRDVRAVHRHRAHEPAARHQRQHQDRPDAEALGDVARDGGRHGVGVHDDGLPRLDGAQHHRDPGRARQGREGCGVLRRQPPGGGGNQPAGGGLPQEDAAPAQPEELGRHPGHGVEHATQLLERPGRLGQREEGPRHLGVLLLGGEEPGVRDGEAGLTPDALDEPQLLRRERPCLGPPEEQQPADRRVLGDHRHEEQRPGRQARQQRRFEARVGGRVRRHHRLPRRPGLLEEPVAAQRDHERVGVAQVPGNVVAGDGAERDVVGLGEECPGGVRAERARGLARDAPQHLREVQGRAESLAHAEEGLGLPQAVAGGHPAHGGRRHARARPVRPPPPSTWPAVPTDGALPPRLWLSARSAYDTAET
jgi:hypothetical protein